MYAVHVFLWVLSFFIFRKCILEFSKVGFAAAFVGRTGSSSNSSLGLLFPCSSAATPGLHADDMGGKDAPLTKAPQL